MRVWVVKKHSILRKPGSSSGTYGNTISENQEVEEVQQDQLDELDVTKFAADTETSKKIDALLVS